MSCKTNLIIVLLLLLGTHRLQAGTPSIEAQLEPGNALNTINMLMVHDVVSPPVAARYYAYTMLGAYAIVAAHDQRLPVLPSLVKSFPATLQLDTVQAKYDYRVAAYYSILETARLLLPSGEELANEQARLLQELGKAGFKPAVLTQSVRVGKLAAAAVVGFSKTDRYAQLSALKRYAPLKEDGKWYPTPPAYLEPVEPNWKTIRPLMIDSAQQFRPALPVPFSRDTASAFHRQAKAVYNVSRQLTADQTQIAQFWDCNPFAVNTAGHMAIGFKKISPGGHWMNIAALVSRQAKLGFDKTVVVLCLEGVTLMDAFISCWEIKYATNRIRPETYINRHVDVKWQPMLQTPPFPEYTSGHAVVSNASAELLTYLLGDNIAYVDDTEIPFGSGERAFTSFRQAATEASISRFYGGIHYLESINNGNDQGKQIGRYIVARLRNVGLKPLASSKGVGYRR
ncbi:vanadium-dependent haloperoxidase [Hymenobacter sp. BT186]|uniref:Vanadium-dependent haloperoxidase n=1 Tax=Hymenobacter telluris TaxID=2816474 RepID=A0A939JDQ2_9BACT|nr:vanadium-dependent haloperoxidase [Hymenobacter telluris]MBO0358587.1 vanadium-dependent haloperoxidase [Hymenobacter telluris]MBW3374613.1 vanadium-dependent haloperoxidase [Hymenobacter norwichensis]